MGVWSTRPRQRKGSDLMPMAPQFGKTGGADKILRKGAFYEMVRVWRSLLKPWGASYRGLKRCY